LPVRRFLAIVLLALLPLQFSWAAVASYCGHETQATADHFGHHDHQHRADSGGHVDAVADRVANAKSTADATADVQGDKAPGAMDLDCGHCHGFCGVMLTLPAAIPGAPGTARTGATVDESVGAHAPTRPERPQWLPLA
jgi:hypothetical protein